MEISETQATPVPDTLNILVNRIEDDGYEVEMLAQNGQVFLQLNTTGSWKSQCMWIFQRMASIVATFQFAILFNRAK